MGYTHSFRFRLPKGIRASELESAYQLAIVECGKVARAYNQECAERGDEYARLSGYTAHCKPGTYGGIKLNGKGDLAHEPFELREHFKQNLTERDNNGALIGSGFCKTDRKPYDTVVVACLAILKYRLDDAIELTTDGNASDWSEGVDLARRVIRRKVPNPISKGKRKSVAQTQAEVRA